jgi:hypothetical protein
MSKTVMDYASNVWVNYIAKSGSKAKAVVKSKKPMPSNEAEENIQQGYKNLSPEKRRLIAEESPLLMKGIKKKCADTFRAWFILEPLKKDGKLVQRDMDLLTDFELRSNYKGKLTEAKRASHIYGNGFLLIDFRDDENLQIHDPPMDSKGKTLEPWDVKVMNSEYIQDLKYYDETYEKAGILHYHYLDKDMKEMYIHPDRIQWIPANLIPGHNLGVSTIDLLRWTMFSKKNIDIAAGHILAWHAHGIRDWEILDMSDDDRKYYEKLAATYPGTIVHDQDMKMSMHNPTTINPKEFYDYVVLNIAAALNMPTHVLTGIQMGRVTGAEIGFADYYRDVTDDQELEMEPLIRNLYTRILESNGKKWKYKITWNPIYIDEAAENKLLDIKVTAADKAKKGGLVDLEEGRRMINEGQIELEPTKKIEQPITPQPGIPDGPAPGPKDPTKKPSLKLLTGKAAEKADAQRLKKKEQSYKITGGLGEEERAMISRCKEARERLISKKVKAEQELGKNILDEQND